MPALKGARRSLQKGHHRAPDLNLGPHVVRWRDRRDRSSRRDVRAEGEIRAESVLAAPLLQMRYSPGPRRLRIVGFRGLGQLRTRTENPRIVGLDCATRSEAGEGASETRR